MVKYIIFHTVKVNNLAQSQQIILYLKTKETVNLHLRYLILFIENKTHKKIHKINTTIGIAIIYVTNTFQNNLNIYSVNYKTF